MNAMNTDLPFPFSLFVTFAITTMASEKKSCLRDTSLLKVSGWFTVKWVHFRDSTKDQVIAMRHRRDGSSKKESFRPEEVSPFRCILVNFAVVCSAFSVCFHLNSLYVYLCGFLCFFLEFLPRAAFETLGLSSLNFW